MAKKSKVNFYIESDIKRAIEDLDNEQIKLMYESNPDTNAFTNALKEKLLESLGLIEVQEILNTKLTEHTTNWLSTTSTRLTNTGPIVDQETLDIGVTNPLSMLLFICKDNSTKAIDSTVVPKSYVSSMTNDEESKIAFFNNRKIYVKHDNGILTFRNEFSNDDRFDLDVYLYEPRGTSVYGGNTIIFGEEVTTVDVALQDAGDITFLKKYITDINIEIPAGIQAGFFSNLCFNASGQAPVHITNSTGLPLVVRNMGIQVNNYTPSQNIMVNMMVEYNGIMITCYIIEQHIVIEEIPFGGN